MAPTPLIVIVFPSLESIVTALMGFHRAVFDFILDHHTLLGFTLIFLSHNTEYIPKLVSSSYIVHDCSKTVYPSPDLEHHESSALPVYHSYGAIEGSDHAKSDVRIKEKELGCFWRGVFSWVLLVGGLFIMILHDE